MWRPPIGSLAASSPSTKNLMEFLEQDESPHARTVFVGNVDARVTRKMLYELMLQVGPVEAVRIVPPRDKVPRTIAFVRFEHAVSVRYALLVLQDVRLFRSSLSLNFSGVNKARPRPDYPPWPTTFFEIPPGFENVSDKKRASTVKRKIISDPAEYHTGYFVRNNEVDEEEHYENSEDDEYNHRSGRLQRPRNGDNHRFNARDNYRTRSDRGENVASYHRRPPSEEPPRRSQHIRFDDKHDHSGDAERQPLQRSRKTPPFVDDGGGNGEHGRRRKGKKSKKDHRSSSSKRKRTH